VCGIAGLFRFGRPPDTRPIEAMIAVQQHRGPDEMATCEVPDGALGAARLAILDPAGGQQPRLDASGRYCIALNGEIYNHAALRAEAASRGVRFRTTCDTEVVVERVAERGFVAALADLEGMFGLAVHDREEGCLWLARDRLGEKPLYWTSLEDGTFLFSSEIKGLLAHPAVRRELDPAALGAYLAFEFVPTPRSIYRGIRRLEQGTWLRVDARGERRGSFWTQPVPRASRGSGIGLDGWAGRLSAAFDASIATRRVADVPVGVVLSGGLDSTAVLAAAQRGASEPVRTFTVAMPEDPTFDESARAAAVAARYRTEHRVVPLRPGQLPELLDAIGAQLCEPLGDGSLPATWALYREVHAAGFKAVLSGDGGDELLGGYPTYLAHRWAAGLAWLRTPLRRAVARLPVSFDNVSLDYRARRLAEGLGQPVGRRNQVWLGAFLPEELPDALAADLWSEIDALAAAAASAAPACTAMYLDQRLYLGDCVLAKVDRASMASSVEVRTPFLDHRLVELAAACPVGLKIGLRATKRVWRRALCDRLPDDVLHGPKKGFGTPLGPWLRGPCSQLLDDLPERVAPWLAPAQVQRLVREHRAGRADHRRRLWTLLVLGRWLHGPWGPYGSPCLPTKKARASAKAASGVPSRMSTQTR